MTLVKFNHGKKENALSQDFNNVFDSIFNDTFFSDRLVSRVPAANIAETQDHYHIELAAPGLKKNDFKLNLERNLLSISVEQQRQSDPEQKNYNKKEYSYNSFVRAFTLPDSADINSIEAAYTDGLLLITIAKKEEAKMVSRQIEIK